MKNILHIITGILLLFAGGAAKAQVSLNPSSLTWEADETDARYVTITSVGGNGQWVCDSTLYSNHFQISSQSGNSGAAVSITPLSSNTGGAIDGSVAFFNPNTGAWAVLYLLHRGPVPTFSVEPLSLCWGSGETQSKTVTVTGSGWSSSVVGSGFSRVENTSAGTITVTPDGPNAGTTARTANLQVSIGTNDKYVSLRQEASSGASVVPGSLTWAAGSTQTKTAVVTCNGGWQCDSSVIGGHFAVSPMSGVSGSSISVTPLSVNARPCDIAGSVHVTTSGDILILSLVHEEPQVSLSISSSALQWQWNDASPKTVIVNAGSPWSAVLDGSGFSMERNGNTLTFTPVEGWNDTATPQDASFSVTCGNATVSGTLSRGAAPYLDGFTSNTSYIQKTTFLTADGRSYVRDVSYYDGLGYPLQEVAVGASPLGGGSIVTPIVYDNMRRGDATAYLPYVRTTGGAGLEASTTVLTSQGGFYYTYKNDTHPFSQKEYGTSPLGQVKSIQKEGDAWAAGNGHKATISRTGYTSSDSLMKFRYVPSSVNSLSGALYDGTDQYATGQLRRTRTTGEDGITSDTFTDALGRTICTRTWDGADTSGTPSDTYYVRDHRDSVVLVIQPEGAVQVKRRYESATPAVPVMVPVFPDTTITNGDICREYCFSYRYDALGNLISEHVPGGGTTEREYDARRRVVLETNDLMKGNQNGPRYIRTMYDNLNRIVSKSIEDASHNTLYTFYIASYFPFSGSSGASSGFTPDDVATTVDLETTNIKGLLKSETLGQMPSADGTLPEEGSPWITRNYYYDNLGRVIQTTESDYPGWTATYSTKYDFTGKVIAKREYHCVPDDNSGQTLLTQYSYDDRGRLLSTSREVDGMELANVNCSYDALGRLTGKTFGNAMESGFGTQSFDYDIHGWTTGISASYNGNDLFSETLRYASTQKPGTAARWDGNIAEAAFTDPDGTHTYAYIYDGMGRLTDAKHYAGASNTATNARTERFFSYDRNGNITALTRYDEAGTGTPLSFAFTGNRIAADTHDAMGNLTRNSRNGLEFSYNLANLPESVEGADGASLTYSYLSDGSKWRASANSGPSILYRGSFVYEDDGNSSRISSIAWDEGRISYHYAPEAVDSLVVDSGEGVVDSLEVVGVVDSLVVEDGICDEWHVRDHLGSVRAIAGIGNYITGIRELNSYLPFGTRIPGSIQAADNRHRFSGKEEQRYGSLSLGLSDFGARYYDPFTCRWTTRDPLAGKYYGISPYTYCAGNPINVTDPSGSVLETAWDVASLAMGVKSFVSNVKNGRVGAAIMDGVGIVLDAAAVVAPCVPGGVSAGIKAARGADKAVDAVKALNKADDVADAVKGVSHVSEMRRGVANEAKTLEKLGETKNTRSFTKRLDDGTIKTTIPDINNGTTVGEIKDTKAVYNTKQIQAERKAAQDSGKEFKIYTGTNTHVSSNIPESEIVRLPWLGPQ